MLTWWVLLIENGMLGIWSSRGLRGLGVGHVERCGRSAGRLAAKLRGRRMSSDLWFLVKDTWGEALHT